MLVARVCSLRSIARSQSQVAGTWKPLQFRNSVSIVCEMLKIKNHIMADCNSTMYGAGPIDGKNIRRKISHLAF